MEWQYHNPVRVIFGRGAFAEMDRLIAGRAYGLVTYPEPYFQGLAEDLARRAGPASVSIDDVAANPDYQVLARQCGASVSQGAPALWVALGGGSVIDSAKVLAAAGGDFAAVRSYLETGQGGDGLRPAPIIAVPTTAGTGSEVTCWATVWDRQSGRKHSLAKDDLYPEAAVVDPQLMLGKSRDLTISTGLDALSHALESLWNVNANPVSANYAVSAAREVLETLPRLADDLTNIDLRSRMARAALFAGLAFSNTKTAIAHALSYPITLRHGVPHGIACSFTLPLVVEAAKDAGGLCEAALRRIFDDDLEGAADRLADVLARLGVSTSPAAHGVTAAEWQDIVAGALDGERGMNFIGRKDAFMAAAADYGTFSP